MTLSLIKPARRPATPRLDRSKFRLGIPIGVHVKMSLPIHA